MEAALWKQSYYDIFLSYHSDQSNEVRRLYKILKSYGFRIWLNDNCSNQFGQNIFDESLTALRKSFIFLLIHSESYSESIKCRVELRIALEQKLSIVNLIHSGLFLSEKNIEENNFVFQLIKSRKSNTKYIEIKLDENDIQNNLPLLFMNSSSMPSAAAAKNEKLKYLIEQMRYMINYEIKTNDVYKMIIAAHQNKMLFEN
jgi:hypothetical protein